MSYNTVCGCYIYNPKAQTRTYLPQIKLDAHTTILSTASRTVLTQTFVNQSKESLDEIRYAFPLYDGVSVVDFYCQVGERTIYGLVKEKSQAKKTYNEAKERGKNAALLEQLPDAADVFTTTISNIGAGSSVRMTVKYVQELKHDAEVDGVRLTIPTAIAPRYGGYPGDLQKTNTAIDSKGMSITVDVSMAEGIPVKKIISPSHPIQVTLGSLSTSTADEDPSLSRGSASLALDTAELEKDFVLQVVAKDVGVPQAILETHPTLPNQRALMTTLVPKFNIKSQKPEIFLIADRSGSICHQIPTLVAALKVFLKSIPLGCTFNICSFGNTHEFLWNKSQIYDEDTLERAINHVNTFAADFGGTETLSALQACFKARSTDSPTELILLTDGDIWSQENVFEVVSQEAKKGDVRVFALGIGDGVSSSLIEGIARAGRGFAQMVADNEKLDSKIVRMLKGALTPHVNDYRLDIKYEDDSIDSVADSLRVHLEMSDSGNKTKGEKETEKKPISLYDPEAKEGHPKDDEDDGFMNCPELKRPAPLQTPHEIPALFPFHRTCVYLLMAPESSHLNPKSVILRGTSPQGPLEVEIPVQQRQEPDEMIHQLAARKAQQELEEGHGWISDATLDDTGVLLREKHPTAYAMLKRREAVRLGVEFQVGGKFCSFVAVEANEAEIAKRRQKALSSTMSGSTSQDEEDWEVIENPPPSAKYEAPRRKLASKALLHSSGSRVRGSMTGLGFGRGGGMGRAAAMGGFRSGFAKFTAAVSEQAQEEKEESDEEMGFGLFDDDDGASIPSAYAQPPTLLASAAPYSPASPGYSAASPVQSPGSARGNALGSPIYASASLASAPAPAGINSQHFARGGTEREEKKDEEPLLNRIISHQSFAGSWSQSSTFPFHDLHLDAAAVASAARGFAADAAIAAGDVSDAERILATAVIILFLERKMADDEETWELVVEKARAWLGDKVVDEKGLDEVWRVAGELVGA